MERKHLDCIRKLQENDDKNKKTIKNFKKSNKNIIELLKELNTTKIERVKDNSATSISLLSNVLKEEMNSKTACLQLCEKIEENKKPMECDIVKLKCDHNNEIVLLKNEFKVHEEKQDRMEWIFG